MHRLIGLDIHVGTSVFAQWVWDGAGRADLLSKSMSRYCRDLAGSRKMPGFVLLILPLTCSCARRLVSCVAGEARRGGESQ